MVSEKLGKVRDSVLFSGYWVAALLRTFTPKSSHVQIFSKLLLSLDNDQLMSEKQKNWGVTVLVSEIKRVGNAVF